MTCDRETTKIHYSKKILHLLALSFQRSKAALAPEAHCKWGRLSPSVPWRCGRSAQSHEGKADVRKHTFRCRRTPWCTSPGGNLRRVGPRVLSGGESCSHFQQQSTGAVVQWDPVVGGVLALVGAMVAVDSSPGEKSGGTTVGWS